MIGLTRGRKILALIRGIDMSRVKTISLIVALMFLMGHMNLLAQCDWDCRARELSDVIAMIGFYRGCVQPYRFCDCGPYGDHFPVCADPNGNCIPMELSDVVFTIYGYRGGSPPIMCPDCL